MRNYEAKMHGNCNGLCASRYIQFRKYIHHVVLHGLNTDAYGIGNLVIRVSVANELEQLKLSRC
jgi:hypothetical protein